MTVTHGPVVIRRRLGNVLKQLRTERSMQLAEVAKRLEVSPSKLSRIETGQVEPKLRDVRDLLDIYQAPTDLRDKIMDWAGDAKSPGWWQPLVSRVSAADLDLLISLETEAGSKCTFSMPIAGLLQTEDYARSILTGALPDQPEREREHLVELRIGRQVAIDPERSDVPPLDLHVVLDESALYRCTDEEIMKAQLRSLVQRSEQPNVRIQVLPFSAGWTPACSTFSIFEPRDANADWPVVNVESTGGDAYLDTHTEVAQYRAIWQRLVDLAMSTDASRRFITELAQ